MDVVFDLAGIAGARIQPTMRFDVAIGERIDPGLVVVTGRNMKKPSQRASVHIRAKARPANAVRVDLLKHQQVCRRRLVDLVRFRKNHILRKIGNNDVRPFGGK